MKWATPASAVDSRREPASTYAATDTERDAGRRAEMTRGPSGSWVRWNIGPMVAPNRRPAASRAAGRVRRFAGTRSAAAGYCPMDRIHG